MISLRLVCLMILPVLVLGCENSEEKARYVKEPLERISTTNRVSLNAAVTEAKTRLVTVRGRELRAGLAADIDDAYSRAATVIETAERQEAARIAAEAERRRELERKELERQEELRAAIERQKKIDSDKASVRRASHRIKSDGGFSDQPSRRRAKEGVTDLEVRLRDSALGDGTKVLVLRNAKPYAVDFQLRCYTEDDRSRTLAVTVPAGAERHIGFLQGWCGNFRSGQRCEAYVDEELMWKYEVP
jgi:hypothetical protein